MPKSKLSNVLALLPIALLFACEKSQPAPLSNPPESAGVRAEEPTDPVLAVVNGIPITRADVRRELATPGSKGQPTTAEAKGVLENLIRQELARQKAVALGIDADEKYRKELRAREAELQAFKRKALSALFVRSEIEKKAEVTDAEAKRFFVENAARIRSEIRVLQILVRDEQRIQHIQERLKRGTSFEAVAASLFPKLPAGSQEPWDLGYLKWNQVPQAWSSVVYELEKGQTSGIIRGENQRFWLVKVLDKRELGGITYESVKPTIVALLESKKTQTLRDETQRALRRGARIEYKPIPLLEPGEQPRHADELHASSGPDMPTD